MSETSTPMGGEPTDRPRSEPVAAELRAEAVKRLNDRRGLIGHALAYFSFNLLLVAIWWASGRGFFWPLFPLFGWGIGLAFHALGVLWPEPDEAQIEREVGRLQQRRHRQA